MATYASRPAWELRARSVTGSAVAVPLGLGLLVAASLLLRTTELGEGFWIDEGLSVGIAERPLSDIPGALRRDGSPPLYYVLLHFWRDAAGRSEESAHAFSLLCALLVTPLMWWGARRLFGTRAGWIGAALAALNPFLTLYAQEARMYALLILFGLFACIAFLLAFAGDDEETPTRRWALAFGVTLAAMLYTHNWGVFFGGATGLAWLALVRLAPPRLRGARLRDGALAYGVAALLYLPWVPTLLFQAAHTGAPWAQRPGVNALSTVPERLLGTTAGVLLALAAGSGLVALLKTRHAGRLTPQGQAVVALFVLALATVFLAFAASQLSPAWAQRYLAVALPAFLLLAVAGLAAARGLGLAGLALVAIFWATDGPPAEKSNVRDVTESIAPSLAPGDVVVSTQPEQVPVLDYYLPEGLRYATLTGPVSDAGVTDWRDGVDRLRASSAERDLAPILDALPVGRRLVLVTPIFYDKGRWRAPWTELVRLRSEQWNQFVSNDRRFRVTAIQPPSPFPRRPNALKATVLLKTA